MAPTAWHSLLLFAGTMLCAFSMCVIQWCGLRGSPSSPALAHTPALCVPGPRPLFFGWSAADAAWHHRQPTVQRAAAGAGACGGAAQQCGAIQGGGGGPVHPGGPAEGQRGAGIPVCVGGGGWHLLEGRRFLPVADICLCMNHCPSPNTCFPAYVAVNKRSFFLFIWSLLSLACDCADSEGNCWRPRAHWPGTTSRHLGRPAEVSGAAAYC